MEPHDSIATPGRDRRVLIAVRPPAFARLIEHVLQDQPGLQVVGRSSGGGPLAHRVNRLVPDVIVANTRLLGREGTGVVADLKRSSPASTLILLTDGFGEVAPCLEGVDAWLPEEAVVRRLVPVVRKLAAQVRDRVLVPAEAGRRSWENRQ